MEKKITIKAYAKVNLGLDVLRKREDGYHEVKMIMQSIDLYDVLTFETEKEASNEDGIRIVLVGDDSKKNEEIPLGSGNLIYKAVKMVKDSFDIRENVLISLEKNIPVAAGMAGGSTDCAAAFKGMNELFSLGLSEEELKKKGVKLGADVPYCIMGGTCLSEGIGEKLTRIKDTPDIVYLIVKPLFGVSTKEVYTNLRANDLKPEEHPDIDGMIAAIEAADINGVADRMGNVLELVTIPMHGEIEELKIIMKEYGALNSLMSGSGPTVFGLFDSTDKAWEAVKVITKLDYVENVYVVGGTK